MDREPASWRSCLLSMLIIFGIIGSVALVAVVYLDTSCYNDLTRRMPIYPGAEVVSQYYSMFRPFGMGDTRLILHSADDPLTVRNWYARTIGMDARERMQGGGRVGNADWEVLSDPVEGGSLISLYGNCVVEGARGLGAQGAN